MRKNPQVITHETPLELDARYDVANSDFMIAFALDQSNGGVKYDQRYYQWAFKIWKYIDGVESSKYYPVHPCTDKEFARFYPVEKNAAIKVEKFQAAGHWMCADFLEFGEDLYGNWRSHDSYTAFEPSIYPCATRVEYFDGSVSGGHDGCEWDHTAV